MQQTGLITTEKMKEINTFAKTNQEAEFRYPKPAFVPSAPTSLL